ncbi:MAG: peptidylprolyl isomerase, partial [Tissierellales bacterium]|nr:peptidylprolyl isomerase [Tissierellales bacterium]
MYDDTNYISIDSLKDLLKARLDYYSKNKTFNLLFKKQYLYQNNPLVTIELDNGKTLEIELYPSDAPNTVSNFIALIKNGFYKGKSFHRMLADNMIQGGQDLENTMKYLLPGEFATNGYENTLMQTRATISMVNFSSHPVSSPTEFFINVVDHPSLNGNFAPFGRVINGMDVIDEISRTKTDANASAINPVVIKNIT